MNITFAMKALIMLLAAFLLGCHGRSSVPVTFTVRTDSIIGQISPRIYSVNAYNPEDGIDGQLVPGVAGLRLGGNRIEGYNWLSGASHAGKDYGHQNDNHLITVFGGEDGNGRDGGLMLELCRRAKELDAYPLLGLPLLGYVAGDMAGPVQAYEHAPSDRFRRIAYGETGLPSSGQEGNPVIHMDELVALLRRECGSEPYLGRGVAYSLGNEPALWRHTHPRMQRDPISALYGWESFRSLQYASDWEEIGANHAWFIDYFLHEMKLLGAERGQTLLDVLDIHWYPMDAFDFGGDRRLEDRTRLEVPRSLWDDQYVEESWIGRQVGPIRLLPRLKESIHRSGLDAKLSVSEYDFGSPETIYGGIAQADALGIFGTSGVHFAAKWGSVSGFVGAAYALYRDYDGKGGSFPEMSLKVELVERQLASVYAAVPPDTSAVHMIVINKSGDHPLKATARIAGDVSGEHLQAWKFDGQRPLVIEAPRPAFLDESSIQFRVPPLTAYHVIITGDRKAR